MTMGEMMHRTLCLLGLMLCCACGCVTAAADPQKPSTEIKAAGYGIGSTGPKSASGAPGSDRVSSDGAVPGGVGPGPQNALGRPYPGAGIPGVQVDNKTGCPLKDGKVMPCLPCKAGVTSTDEAPCVPATPETKDIVYGGPDMAGITLPKSTASSDLSTRGTSDVGAEANPQKAPNEVIATQGNLSRVKEHMSHHGTDVKGNKLGSHPVPVFSCPKEGHSCDGPGIPGNVVPTPPPTSPGSHPGVGDGVVPGFPGVHPNVTHTDTASKALPGVPEAAKVTVGPPTVARNRRSGPIPPPPIPEVSQSGGETSTSTHHENGNQADNTAAPSPNEVSGTSAQSESIRNTPNTPTKVTSPAMPTILQPPMPAKSEDKLPPKKRKADSSSMSSVWVRVPLLIVVVLFSAAVY